MALHEESELSFLLLLRQASTHVTAKRHHHLTSPLQNTMWCAICNSTQHSGIQCHTQKIKCTILQCMKHHRMHHTTMYLQHIKGCTNNRVIAGSSSSSSNSWRQSEAAVQTSAHLQTLNLPCYCHTYSSTIAMLLPYLYSSAIAMLLPYLYSSAIDMLSLTFIYFMAYPLQNPPPGHTIAIATVFTVFLTNI